MGRSCSSVLIAGMGTCRLPYPLDSPKSTANAANSAAFVPATRENWVGPARQQPGTDVAAKGGANGPAVSWSARCQVASVCQLKHFFATLSDEQPRTRLQLLEASPVEVTQ